MQWSSIYLRMAVGQHTIRRRDADRSKVCDLREQIRPDRPGPLLAPTPAMLSGMRTSLIAVVLSPRPTSSSTPNQSIARSRKKIFAVDVLGCLQFRTAPQHQSCRCHNGLLLFLNFSFTSLWIRTVRYRAVVSLITMWCLIRHGTPRKTSAATTPRNQLSRSCPGRR